jgi:hypothetical protein
LEGESVDIELLIDVVVRGLKHVEQYLELQRMQV